MYIGLIVCVKSALIWGCLSGAAAMRILSCAIGPGIQP